MTCATLSVSSIRAHAQSRSPAGAVPEWKSWLSLSVGPAAVNGEGHAGATLALWGTHDAYAFAVRAVGASRLFEIGDAGDLSVLAGLHPLQAHHADGVVAAGVGLSSGHRSSTDEPFHEPVFAGSAQLNFNYVLVGIGVDGFIGVGPTTRYYGVGLAVAFGAFQ
jgi:hypothetical protein